MAGKGPYLWLGRYAPPAGFRSVPDGAMCLSVFVFVRRGNQLLLYKVREHPAWPKLAGEDASRVAADAGRWKVPARQLKLGEDPRDAARQVGEQILGLRGLRYGEPRVEVEFWRLGKDASGPARRRKLFHFDVWFLFEARAPKGLKVQAPPWLSELAWRLPASIPAGQWARYHNEVVARWRSGRRQR